jgi:hypothetical protein
MNHMPKGGKVTTETIKTNGNTFHPKINPIKSAIHARGSIPSNPGANIFIGKPSLESKPPGRKRKPGRYRSGACEKELIIRRRRAGACG